MKYQVKETFEDVVRDYEQEVGTLSVNDRNELRRVYEAAARTLENVLETTPCQSRGSYAEVNVFDGRFYASVVGSSHGNDRVFPIDDVDELEYPCDADYSYILTCDLIYDDTIDDVE